MVLPVLDGVTVSTSEQGAVTRNDLGHRGGGQQQGMVLVMALSSVCPGWCGCQRTRPTRTR